MNVYDQAHGLASAIKESEEFKQYNALKKQIDANEELSKMLKDFQAKQLEFQTKQMMGTIMAADPLTSQYLQAEMRFSLMMKDVYGIIGEAIGVGDLLG